MPQPDLELRAARNATRWATLTDRQRKRLCLRHAWHLIAYAQAKRWCKERPPKVIIKFKRPNGHVFGTVHGPLP